MYIYDCCKFIYIDQRQKQLHLTNNQVIPNAATCNPTDDTAHNDDLLTSFASYCHTSNHGSHGFHGQNSNHQNHFAFSARDDKHSTNHDNPSYPFNYSPMLPPPEHYHNYFGSPKIHSLVDQYNHYIYPQSHFVNESINHSSCHQDEQSLQRESNIQPPQNLLLLEKPM